MNRPFSLTAVTAALAIAMLLPIAAAVTLSVTLPASALTFEISTSQAK
ncbi:hypothetical protein [Nioella aestuarii]